MRAPRRRTGCSIQETGRDSGKCHVRKQNTKSILMCVHADNRYPLYRNKSS